ncbi:MAG: DoxX family protein [Bacteroidetes bacterium]|nr:DoxX family protein [Bacteroidota bacterium]
MKSKTLQWILSIVSALILFMTLFYKFTGAEESIYIFTTMGMEPWGRYFSGVVELVAGIILLLPRFRHVGALLAFGMMAAALLSHLFVLGIEVQGDGGLLFDYAIVVFLCSAIILYINRNRLKPGKFLSFEA